MFSQRHTPTIQQLCQLFEAKTVRQIRSLLTVVTDGNGFSKSLRGIVAKLFQTENVDIIINAGQQLYKINVCECFCFPTIPATFVPLSKPSTHYVKLVSDILFPC